MKKFSQDLKALEATKEAFLRKIGSSWEEAVEAIPEYTDDNKITKGKTLHENFKVNDVMILARTYLSYSSLMSTIMYVHIYRFSVKKRRLRRKTFHRR